MRLILRQLAKGEQLGLFGGQTTVRTHARKQGTKLVIVHQHQRAKRPLREPDMSTQKITFPEVHNRRGERSAYNIGDQVWIAHQGKPTPVVITKVGHAEAFDDGLSFGLGQDDGWVRTVSVRHATAEEAATMQATRDAARAAKTDAQQRLAADRQWIDKDGPAALRALAAQHGLEVLVDTYPAPAGFERGTVIEQRTMPTLNRTGGALRTHEIDGVVAYSYERWSGDMAETLYAVPAGAAERARRKALFDAVRRRGMLRAGDGLPEPRTDEEHEAVKVGERKDANHRAMLDLVGRVRDTGTVSPSDRAVMEAYADNLWGGVTQDGLLTDAQVAAIREAAQRGRPMQWRQHALDTAYTQGVPNAAMSLRMRGSHGHLDIGFAEGELPRYLDDATDRAQLAAVAERYNLDPAVLLAASLGREEKLLTMHTVSALKNTLRALRTGGSVDVMARRDPERSVLLTLQAHPEWEPKLGKADAAKVAEIRLAGK